MLHKTSSDIRCVICGSTADKRIYEKPVCQACSDKQDVKEFFERLNKFD